MHRLQHNDADYNNDDFVDCFLNLWDEPNYTEYGEKSKLILATAEAAKFWLQFAHLKWQLGGKPNSHLLQSRNAFDRPSFQRAN